MAVAVLSLVGAQALPAHAEDAETRVLVLNESDFGPTDSTSPLSEPCPTDYPYGDPSVADVEYKTFVADSTQYQILLDVYEPPGTAPEPGVVLVHGGGTFQGCKSAVNRWAVTMAENPTSWSSPSITA